MTKSEAIIVKSQHFVARRGRTVESQTREFLRELRHRNNPCEDLGAYAVRVPGWGTRYCDTLRRAKIQAKRWAIHFATRWGEHYDIDVFDANTGVCIYTA